MNSLLMMIIALLLSLQYAAAAGSETAQEAWRPWEEYKVIVERNIFLPSRSRSTPSTPARTQTTPVQTANRDERSMILRGVIRQGEEYLAFLEDSRSGEVTRLGANGPVAGGYIARIQLDRIEYKSEGRVVAVAIGQALDGTTPAAGIPALAGATGGASVGTRLPAAGAGQQGEPSTLERLRLRRQQELSGTPTPAAPAGTAPPAADIRPEDQLSTLERLRLRRQQELNAQ